MLSELLQHMVTAARRMSAQLFAPSRSQTLYVKNSLHHATGTKASSYWEDGAGQGGEERRKLKSNKYLQGHLSSRLEKGCLESRKELGCGREFSFYTNYIWILTWSFILFYFLSVYYRNRICLLFLLSCRIIEFQTVTGRFAHMMPMSLPMFERFG